MNKVIACILFTSITFFATAQKVTVINQNEKVKTETVEGFSATLEGKKEDVTAAWVKFLKDIGKAKQGVDVITVGDPVLNGTAFAKKFIYATSKGDEKSTTVWAGIIASEWESTEVNYANRELDKLVYQFGIKYYKDKVQAQIDETQQALDAVERQQQKLVNQNSDLNGKLINNEKEKIQLEKSLEANKVEHAVLLIKIENNKKAQDSIANANAQIKKVMELHKEKYRKIN